MVTIYIEGKNLLREGFSKLLSKFSNDTEFQVIMGRSNLETVRKFKQHRDSNTIKYLLVDLDMPENRRHERIREYNLSNEDSNVFFMIQEMEAWFLSQQKVLNEYYGAMLKYPNQPAHEIEKPSRTLANITATIKNRYEKTVHAIDLLERLDISELSRAFTDVKNLRQKVHNS